MQLSVYVFGHGEVVREYFNAIAAMMGAKPYATAIHIAVLLAGITVLFQYMTRRSLLDIARWMLLYYVVLYVMLAPKVTIAIEDKVNQRTFLVANVPLGIGVLAHYTSALGAALTEMTEINFTLPGDLRYGHSGMVMASRLVSASSTFQIPNPIFNENMQSFVQQCIFYDILLNKYSLNDLEQQDNLWQFMKEKASPARMFPYTPVGGGSPNLVTCKESVSKLNADWKIVITEAQRLYGTRLFPYHNNPGQQFARYLPGSYSYLLKASRNASDILQQSMLANAVSNTAVRFSSTTDAPAAMQAFITAKTHIQERLTYQTIGERAAHWLPLMKNALEAIMYGAFVIVLLLMIFPFGGMVLKHYTFSLIWLQTWGPLYAIINLIVSYYAERSTVNLVGKSGLTLNNLEGIFSINADMASLAGYLSLSVPMLAFGLVRGLGSTMTSMAQYMGGLTQSVSSQVASEASGGNISVGNTSVDTHSAFNTSSHHMDTTGRFSSGGMNVNMPAGSNLSMTPDGSLVMDTRGAFSNLGSNVQFSYAQRAVAMQQSELALQAAFNNSHSFQDSTASSLRNLSDFANTQGRSESSGEGTTLSNHSGFNESAAIIQRTTQEFAKRNNLSYGEASNVLAQAYANFSAGATLSASTLGKSPGGAALSGDLGARFTGQRSSSDIANVNSDTVYSDAQNVVRDSNYSSSVENALRATKDSSFRASSEEGQRLTSGVSASFEHAQQARHDMMSNLQQSEAFRQSASYSNETAVSMSGNATQKMFEGITKWMADQPGTNGRGKLGLRDAEKMQTSDPEMFAGYVKKYVDSMGGAAPASMGTAASVSDTHHRYNQSMPGADNIAKNHSPQQQQINESAGKFNLGNSSIVDKTAKQDVQSVQQETKQALLQKQQAVSEKSQPVIEKVKGELDKPPQKLEIWNSTTHK